MAFLGVLEPRKQRSLGERLSSSSAEMAPGIAQTLGNRSVMQEENKTLKGLTGHDFEGLSPDLKKEFVKVFTGARSQKEQEKYKMLETGLGTIQQMRGLLESTGPSNWIQGLFPGETAKNRAQFAQLGKSLIPLVAAGVRIVNQKEFDEYKKVITNPNARQAELEGALEGLEDLLSRQTNRKEEPEIEKKVVFDIQNPNHRSVRDKLMKMYKGDRKMVEKKLMEKFSEE